MKECDVPSTPHIFTPLSPSPFKVVCFAFINFYFIFYFCLLMVLSVRTKKKNPPLSNATLARNHSVLLHTPKKEQFFFGLWCFPKKGEKQKAFSRQFPLLRTPVGPLCTFSPPTHPPPSCNPVPHPMLHLSIFFPPSTHTQKKKMEQLRRLIKFCCGGREIKEGVKKIPGLPERVFFNI